MIAQGRRSHALGTISALFDWDWATTGREFQQAIELNSNYATGHQWYADFYLVPQLRLDQAAAEIREARELDPLSPIMIVDDGWVDYLRGDYTSAGRKYALALDMDKTFIPALFRLQNLYLVQGRYEEYAKTAAETLRVGSGSSSEISGAIEEGFARDGMRGVAHALLGSETDSGICREA